MMPLDEWGPRRVRFAELSGAVLGLSYPVLALSTGVRALYQLASLEPGEVVAGPISTLVAAGLYLAATAGFLLRRRWAWYLSVAVLSIESVLTFAVGTASVLWPDRVGSSVWRLYGIDYGFFPLVQPFLGLFWLLWPLTRARYGISRGDVRAT
jgi:hypothetical protein